MAYATADDVYLALSAQAFVVRPRPFEAIEIATGTIRLTAHGLATTDLVVLAAVGAGTLPTTSSAFTAYSPIVVSGDLFKIATTPS